MKSWVRVSFWLVAVALGGLAAACGDDPLPRFARPPAFDAGTGSDAGAERDASGEQSPADAGEARDAGDAAMPSSK